MLPRQNFCAEFNIYDITILKEPQRFTNLYEQRSGLIRTKATSCLPAVVAFFTSETYFKITERVPKLKLSK